LATVVAGAGAGAGAGVDTGVGVDVGGGLTGRGGATGRAVCGVTGCGSGKEPGVDPVVLRPEVE